MKKLSRLVIALIIATPLITSAATFTDPLAIGSRDPQVLMLQQTLATLGLFSVTPTGYFGVITQAAVIAFQKESGIAQVGSVGPLTRAALNSYLVGVLTNAVSQTVVPPPPLQNTTPTTTAATTPVATTSSGASSSNPTSQSATPATTTVPSLNPPVVTLVAPATLLPYNTFTTNLVVTTDQSAQCRFGTQPQMIFPDMTTFENTGGTTHSTPFVNLGNGYLYVYYVRCQSTANLQFSSDTMVSFSIAAHS